MLESIKYFIIQKENPINTFHPEEKIKKSTDILQFNTLKLLKPGPTAIHCLFKGYN